jgi:hypothetical protein
VERDKAHSIARKKRPRFIGENRRRNPQIRGPLGSLSTGH